MTLDERLPERATDGAAVVADGIRCTMARGQAEGEEIRGPACTGLKIPMVAAHSRDFGGVPCMAEADACVANRMRGDRGQQQRQQHPPGEQRRHLKVMANQYGSEENEKRSDAFGSRPRDWLSRGLSRISASLLDLSISPRLSRYSLSDVSDARTTRVAPIMELCNKKKMWVGRGMIRV